MTISITEDIRSITELKRNIRLRSTRLTSDGMSIALNGPKVSQDFTASGSETKVSGSLFKSGAEVLSLSIPATLETALTIEGDASLDLGLTIVKIK